MNIEKITVVRNGEYVRGYRKRYTSSYPLFRGEEKCFKELLDYRKISEQSELIKVSNIYRKLFKYINSIDYSKRKNATKKAMNSFKNATTKEDLVETCNMFFKNVKRVMKKNPSKEEKERETELVKYFAEIMMAYDNYKELMISMLIKRITKDYYSMMISDFDKDKIISMEECKIGNFENENTLDVLLESINEGKTEIDDDYYRFRKYLFSDLLTKKYDMFFNHLCGAEKSCSMEQFKQRAKIHLLDFVDSKIDDYPFIENGIQVEKLNEKGEWITDKMLVSTCNYEKSNTFRRKVLKK